MLEKSPHFLIINPKTLDGKYVVTIFESSANIEFFIATVSARSFMNIKNKSATKCDPYGTPEMGKYHLDLYPL